MNISLYQTEDLSCRNGNTSGIYIHNMIILYFRKKLFITWMAALDEGDGGARASVEEQNESGRDTAGDNRYLNSFNLKEKTYI